MEKFDDNLDVVAQLTRIADALERGSPPPPNPEDVIRAEAYVWDKTHQRMNPIMKVNRLELDLLRGIDQQRDSLLANSIAFARGLSANNALLWGARGTGKSSLVKAVHGTLIAKGLDCALVEIHREDVDDLPMLMSFLSKIDRRFIIFSDDLAFEYGEASYKSLKAALDGGVEGRPDNIIFYATSNRRHLMPRHMMENERSTAINPSEGVEESVSLSDRFGLWIGFHSIDQDTYFAMIDAYIAHFKIKADNIDIRREAIAWSMERGARSGRVAWQFILDLAAKTETNIRQH
ncbi:ATP-binding protein [Alphaproteobacteria bacterium]|nr:ATP-binding protein [Alphaproteobacteria bacterium]